MMHYVYEWFLVETGEVIYVGKGTKKRYAVRKHNRFFNDMIKRFHCENRIVKWFSSEQDAFQYEYDRINALKAIGQCVCNIQRGGFGGTTSRWTDEERKHYSEHNVMKADEQRRRMVTNNPMKNKEIAMKSGEKHKNPVIIGEKEFDSVKEAMEYYGVSYEVISYWCKRGKNKNGEWCRYKDSEQAVPTTSRYNIGSCKSMTYCGKHYESILDFIEDIGITYGTALRWLKRGFDTKGNSCRLDNDHRELVFKSNYTDRFKNRPKRKIVVNGVVYDSIDDASEATGLAIKTILTYIQKPGYSKRYHCTYDNQQPSRAKSDNSSTEGSTTNR